MILGGGFQRLLYRAADDEFLTEMSDRLHNQSLRL